MADNHESKIKFSITKPTIIGSIVGYVILLLLNIDWLVMNEIIIEILIGMIFSIVLYYAITCNET